eukprot:TRINITY_DN2514_c2_g1_i2.p1 TRINITY_DN2514_c2_g1~~TRINITY_DN2514_c2_g1_i2.p1  ORF type:complete len:282 (-),score=85.16 TRINITY_DN2514_c2_g1_i2:79-924(-)
MDLISSVDDYNCTVNFSSIWAPDHTNYHLNCNARVGSSSWCAGVNDENQYVLISYGTNKVRVKKILIQGRGNSDQHVKEFKIKYFDGREWINYKNKHNDNNNNNDNDNDNENDGYAFIANNDRNTIKEVDVNFLAYSLMILPTKWNAHISMRFDVLISNPYKILMMEDSDEMAPHLTEVLQFLKNIRCERYFDDFVEEGFDDLEIIKQLSEHELKNDIGVKTLGHRKKLLRSIFNLNNPPEENYIINSINDISKEELYNKYQDLYKLYQEQNFQIENNNQI